MATGYNEISISNGLNLKKKKKVKNNTQIEKQRFS